MILALPAGDEAANAPWTALRNVDVRAAGLFELSVIAKVAKTLDIPDGYPVLTVSLFTGFRQTNLRRIRHGAFQNVTSHR